MDRARYREMHILFPQLFIYRVFHSSATNSVNDLSTVHARWKTRGRIEILLLPPRMRVCTYYIYMCVCVCVCVQQCTTIILYAISACVCVCVYDFICLKTTGSVRKVTEMSFLKIDELYHRQCY